MEEKMRTKSESEEKSCRTGTSLLLTPEVQKRGLFQAPVNQNWIVIVSQRRKTESFVSEGAMGLDPSFA